MRGGQRYERAAGGAVDLPITMRRPRIGLGLLLCLLVAASGMAAPTGTSRLAAARVAASSTSMAVVDLPISFHVKNINRSKLSCSANGADVTLVGRMVGPAAVVNDAGLPAAVTLYLHEFSFGKWFWHFPDPAYDYASIEARAGHISVLVDRLGYGDSSHPPGFQTCLGADADEDHQMVLQLRAGSYQLGGVAPRPFNHVVLAGHSGGAQGSELEAYSFGGIDGLIIFAHADQGPTLRGGVEGVKEGVTCAIGGQPSEPGGPGGYAYFGATAADWKQDYFQGAEPRIVNAAVPLRHRDPCGDVDSFVQLAILNTQNLHRITVPVLLLYGMSDALFSQPGAGNQQRKYFTGSSDVTLDFFPGSGHALTLEQSAPAIRTIVSGWLVTRGLG